MAPEGSAASRMRLALDLHDLGMRMFVQRLRRERPGATDAEIGAEVRRWLADRPMDAPGRVRPFRW